MASWSACQGGGAAIDGVAEDRVETGLFEMVSVAD